MAKKLTAYRLDRSALHLLHRASQCATELFESSQLGDLTPRQYALLLTVDANKGLSQTQLVELTLVDRSTIADVVRRLVKKGLLRRQRSRWDAGAYAVGICR